MNCLLSRLRCGVVAVVCLVVLPVAAQTPTAPSVPRNAPSQQAPASAARDHDQNGAASRAESQESVHQEAERELREETHQRMAGVVPAFTTVYNGHAAPLDAREKFKLFVADTADPFDFAAAGVDAALEQNGHEFPEYGYGVSGYAKRYGASFVDDADGTLFAEAVLPSLLHQDPRYFRLGEGSIGHRLGYTLLSAVRCRGDNFRWQPNVSLLGGNLIGGAISNAYYPAADRGFGLTMERGFTVTGEDLLSSLATEFYPDISKALFHRKKKAAP